MLSLIAADKLNKAVFVVCIVNLGLLVLAAVNRGRMSPSINKNRLKCGQIAIGLLTLSQVIYLLDLSAWELHHVDSRGLVSAAIMLCGLTLCLAAAVAAAFASGLKRCVSFLVAVTVGGLWLLAAAASAAV